ncbi:MAG: DUF177 domain-containing protein [Gemmatimonadota bacterium]
MLRVDVRDVRKGPVETIGEIPADDPLFKGLELELGGALAVSGLLETTSRGGYFWHGQFEGRANRFCRRCLKEFVQPISGQAAVLFSPDPDLQDDPSVYPLVEPVSQVDVTEAVREELALTVSAYPLCREDCAGLCQRCGADLNLGPCSCTTSTEPS